MQMKLPIGCVLTPLAKDTGEIPVVNFGRDGVVRCKRCRTYINPFVKFVENGRRWECCICGALVDVQTNYFCHLGSDGRRQDLEQRPELLKGQVEIIAPAEYMVRPPQAAAYLFVIDVSYTAVQNGSLATACQTIKGVLDTLPGEPRTHIGFVTFDSAVHFYNLKPSLNQPQLLVMAETEEPFLPAPDDLLVTLKESRELVDMLLDNLPTMFANNKSDEVALGPALQCGYKVMQHIGGKMCVVLSSLPSKGVGRLKYRESPKVHGTVGEKDLLKPQDDFYRKQALEMSRQQISLDLFLCASKYVDVATLGMLPKHTAGELYYYEGFQQAIHGEKFSRELSHTLTRNTGFEAVMRVRCSKGMKVAQFHGNFFIRGTDLLALPNVTEDSTFTVELVHDSDSIAAPVVYIQSALLYTTSSGERRIRVNTMACSVAQRIDDVVAGLDVDTICNLIAKKAAIVAAKSGLQQARSACEDTCVSILRGSRPAAAYSQGLQPMPATLATLPLYLQSLQKNTLLRGGTDVPADLRAFLMLRYSHMTVPMTRYNIFPCMYALHQMSPAAGLAAKEGQVGTGSKNIVLPKFMNLALQRIQSNGVYLLDDGLGMFLWLGRAAPPAAINSLFGRGTLDGVDAASIQLLRREGDATNMRIHAIIEAIRDGRCLFQRLRVVRQGDPSDRFFQMRLVEDRANFPGGQRSYQEFAAHMQNVTKLKIPH